MESAGLQLIILKGPRAGETLDFKPGSTIRIGRVVRGNNVTIKDPGISTKHLKIASESGKWIIEDLGSSNGTFINSSEVSLSPDIPVDLHDNDNIKLGELTTILVKITVGGQDEPNVRRNTRRQATRSQKHEESVEILAAVGGEAIIDGQVESNLSRRNPRRQASVKVTRSQKNEESVENLAVEGEEATVDGQVESKLNRRNMRRQASVKVTRSQKNEESVEDLAGKGEEATVDGQVESKLNRRNPRHQASVKVTRSQKNEESGENLAVEGEEATVDGQVESKLKRNPRRQANVRVTRGRKKEEIVEISSSEGAGKGRGRMKNLKKMSPVNSHVEEPLKPGEVSSGNNVPPESIQVEETLKSGEVSTSKNVPAESIQLEETLKSGEMAPGSSKVKKCSGNKAEDKARSGGVKAKGPDLKNMTLGDWFDFMEEYLPKKITEESDMLIESMRKKADMYLEYRKQQMKEKGKV